MIFSKVVEINWDGVPEDNNESRFFLYKQSKITKKLTMINITRNFLIYSFVFSFIISVEAAEGPTVEDIQSIEAMRLGEDVVLDAGREFREIQTSTTKPNPGDEDFIECSDCIYGYETFNSAPTTFSLSSDVPIPPDYVLGPGDKLTIEYYGTENLKKEGYIVRTGSFHLPLLGPVTLAGLTFNQASNLIAKKVKSELIGTEIFITLSELRSITIYVVGAAYKPGTYTVSGLSTITNALFASGGPDENGSLRNIELKRNGKIIKNYDFYDLILNGDTSSDSRMQQGDVLFIPLIKKSASIKGRVLRPSRYEIKDKERVSALLDFSGFKDQNGKLELSRLNLETNTREFTLFEGKGFLADDFLLEDGDVLSIVNNSNLESRNVLIEGEVFYPGYYGINRGESLYSLIQKAGGLKDSAYTPGAIFTREDVKLIQKRGYLQTADSLEKSLIDAVSQGAAIEGEAYLSIKEFIATLRAKDPAGRQVIETDVFLLKSDPRLNILLQDGDTLLIPKRSSSISVVGEVLNLATHIYKEELAIEDYIRLSGGYSAGADKSKVFVILPNGQSILLKDRLFGNKSSSQLLPGSTIVVSRDPDPFNAFKLISVLTPTLADLAVSAAAIASISDDN